MVVEIKRKKMMVILIILFSIFIVGSITIYFGFHWVTKEVSVKTQQDTIYIDKDGKQIITNETDLSDINSKEIVQIGFYKNKKGKIQVVKMPKRVEKVPEQLPSEINDLYSMFYDNNVFNQDISKWNTSNVKSMNAIFKNSIFNQDISKWNTSNVNNMTSMFANNIFFNKDISSWNVSNVKYMNYMFDNAKSFNQDISKWNVEKVITHIDFANNSDITDNNKLPNFK